MKNEDLFEAIGQVDETLLADAEAKKPKRRWVGWVAGAVAACLCLGVGGYALFGGKEETRWPRKTIYYNELDTELAIVTPETVPDILIEEPWETKAVYEQYPAIMVGEKEYSTRYRDVPLTDDEIGAPMGTAECRGYNVFTDETHTITANIYEIKGVSPDCAVAVELEEGAYYAACYSWYLPETLGDFVEDLNLRENLEVGTVHYSYFEDDTHVSVELYGLTKEMVWDMLLDDLSIEAVKDYDQRWFVQELGFSVSLPLLGYKNVGMGITEDGYLITNILDTGKAFYLGTEKTEAFRDYLFEHLEGQETVIIYDLPTEENTDHGVETAVEEFTTMAYSNGYNPDQPMTTIAPYEPEEPVSNGDWTADATSHPVETIEELTGENGEVFTPAYDPNK